MSPDRILPQIPAAVASIEGERRAFISTLAKTIAEEATKGTHYKAVVRPFNYGNSYYLIVTETFMRCAARGSTSERHRQIRW
jgi:hypothetical protein